VRLVGRVAVVTRAGRGLGEACSQRLAREGAAVAVSDVDRDLAKSVASDLGAPAFGLVMDVRSGESIRAAAA
jgi:3-oxoacyl-[acyl-carrier protein] reductase